MSGKRKTIPYATKLPVQFTREELDLIRDGTFADPSLVSHAIVEGPKRRLDLSLDDIEDLHGYVAAEANHTDDRAKQKRLDRILKNLNRFLDEYDDQADLP